MPEDALNRLSDRVSQAPLPTLSVQFGERWYQSLTERQTEALFIYRTRVGYRALNSWLRGDRADHATHQGERIEDIVGAIDAAMRPLSSSITTYRGFDGLGSPFAEDGKTFVDPNQLVGATFRDSGFVSTGPFEDLAEACARFGVTYDARPSEVPVKISIDVPAQTPVVFLGNFCRKCEPIPEIVLPHDLRYHVLDARVGSSADDRRPMLELHVKVVCTDRRVGSAHRHARGDGRVGWGAHPTMVDQSSGQQR